MKARTAIAYAGVFAGVMAVSGCQTARDYTSRANAESQPPPNIQTSVNNPPTRSASYQIQEIGNNPATADKGPVRLARISYMKGPVAWRPASDKPWSSAGINLPIRQGSTIWVKPSSRCELQFDDGSVVRLGGGAVCTLQNLYSDDRGEFTECTLNDGLATFNLRNKVSVYQVDTPLSAVKACGPANLRIGVGKTVEVACRKGDVDIEGKQGQAQLRSNQMCDIANTNDPYDVQAIPSEDPWDHFNDNRDVIAYHHNRYVPQDIDLVAGDLDSYGTWHDDSRYGHVWAPRVHEAGWRPYHHGHWVWVSPWGWTWVGDEDWGWAPYHYGTWVDEPYGWAWVPGPAVQYWSPAVVDFVATDPYYGWAPLAPYEVRYPPAIDIGFRSGNWWFNFSIGGAAAFFPAGSSYCEPYAWDNVYSNRTVNVYNVTNNYYGPQGAAFFGRSTFIPQNATRFAGTTLASRQAFFNGGGFQAAPRDVSTRVFRTGRSFASMPQHHRAFFGPPSATPRANSFTPTRTFANNLRPPQGAMQRSVFRTGLPRGVAGRSGPMTRTFSPANRVAPLRHAGPIATGPQNRINRGPVTRVAPNGTPNRFNRFNGLNHNPITHNRGPVVTPFANRVRMGRTPNVTTGPRHSFRAQTPTRNLTPHNRTFTPRPQPVRHIQLPPRGFQQTRHNIQPQHQTFRPQYRQPERHVNIQPQRFQMPRQVVRQPRQQTFRPAPQHVNPPPRQHGGGSGGGGGGHGHHGH